MTICRKKVLPLPCTPPSFKNRSYFHKKALLACRPGGLSCGRRMLPHAVCDVASGLFSFGKSPARPACAQKTNACTRQAFGIRAVKSVTVAQRGGPVHSSEENVFGIGRGTGRKKASSYKNALFPSRHSDKIHIPILAADRHPAFMHMTTNDAITVSDVGAVRPKPPGSASQGHLLFSCGCLIRACIMARAGLALLHSEYPR